MVRHQLGVSERRACRVLGHARSTHRHRARVPDDELRLVERIIALATQYGRYGYRRITGLLRGEGWRVNHKRVERLWRREGLKVPQKQPKRGRLWLTDGSCVRCRPAYRLHVWAYDFLTARTHDGRPLKILTVVEEYSRECLAIVVARRLRSTEVLETLAELFVTHGVPAHIRSDNDPEFTATLIRLWLDALQVQTLFIEPGSPWENGYVESFNGKLRDELLDREIFYTLTEAKILIERWRRQYNTVRPHSALGYRPPAPAAISPAPLSGMIMSPVSHKNWLNPGGRVSLGAGVMFGSDAVFAAEGTLFATQLVDLYSATLGDWIRPVVLVAVVTTMLSTTLTLMDGAPRVIERSIFVLRSGTTTATPPSSGPVYWWSLLLLVALTLVVMALFIGNLTTMVDFATIVSFLTGPILGFLTLRAVTSDEMPVEHRPGRAMLVWSWVGLVLLGGTGLFYLLSLFG